MGKQSAVVCVLLAFLVTPMVFGVAGCNGDGGVITPVLDWFVGFATETGEWVIEKATTFGDAVVRAWRAFWGTDKLIVNNVIVDKDNPLRGEYNGVLQCKAEWNRTVSSGGCRREEQERSDVVLIKLDHPKMVRESEDSTDWELAPEEKDRINMMRDQLLPAQKASLTAQGEEDAAATVL